MPFTLLCIAVNDRFESIFTEEIMEKEIRGGMVLSPRIETQSLRLRESAPGYETTWHLAGDPTLIIIQQGVLRITLQNGDYKDFKAGDQFIAKDALPESMIFDETKHGHKAAVVGSEVLKAVHVKLV